MDSEHRLELHTQLIKRVSAPQVTQLMWKMCIYLFVTDNYHSLVKKLYRESRSSHRSDETNKRSHLDYLSTKYGRDTGSRSPSRKPQASQFDDAWYIFEDANSTRSTSPGKLNVTQRYSGNTSPSPIGRPLSILSRSTCELGELSPQSSRSVSPVMYSRHSAASSRSVSPKRNKSGAIGPFTEMMEAARRREGSGKQEYFRGRDSQTGKVCMSSYLYSSLDCLVHEN